MKCPNCGKEMKDKSYSFYGLGSWDMDYPDCLHEEYCCSSCRIKFVNSEWHIPKSIIATEKQINASKIISRNTGINMPPPIKRLMWQYIKDNIELSKQRSEEYKIERRHSFSEWCEDNSDWLPEYF